MAWFTRPSGKKLAHDLALVDVLEWEINGVEQTAQVTLNSPKHGLVDGWFSIKPSGDGFVLYWNVLFDASYGIASIHDTRDEAQQAAQQLYNLMRGIRR